MRGSVETGRIRKSWKGRRYKEIIKVSGGKEVNCDNGIYLRSLKLWDEVSFMVLRMANELTDHFMVSNQRRPSTPVDQGIYKCVAV